MGKDVTKKIDGGLDPRASAFKNLLAQAMPVIQTVAPKHMTPERMARISIGALYKTPKLLECCPFSFVRAIIISSQLGLEVDMNGEGYLIPYYNKERGIMEIEFQPGFRGLAKLARQTKEVVSIEAQVVWENDEFEYALGTKKFIRHIKADDNGQKSPKDFAPIKYAYAIAYFANIAIPPQFEVLTRKEINTIRNASKAPNSPAWVKWFDQMVRAKAVRRLCKFLPASTTLNDAMNLDSAIDMGLIQEVPDELLGKLSEIGVEQPETPENNTQEDVADSLKTKNQEVKSSPKQQKPKTEESPDFNNPVEWS